MLSGQVPLLRGSNDPAGIGRGQLGERRAEKAAQSLPGVPEGHADDESSPMNVLRRCGHGRRRGHSFARRGRRQGLAAGRPALRGVIFPSPSLFQSPGSLMAPASRQERLRESGGWKRQGTKQAVARVDAGRCTGCGACVNVCPMGAVSLWGVARVDSTRCAGCGLCVDHCPVGAISLTEETEDGTAVSAAPFRKGAKSQDDK